MPAGGSPKTSPSRKGRGGKRGGENANSHIVSARPKATRRQSILPVEMWIQFARYTSTQRTAAEPEGRPTLISTDGLRLAAHILTKLEDNVTARSQLEIYSQLKGGNLVERIEEDDYLTELQNAHKGSTKKTAVIVVRPAHPSDNHLSLSERDIYRLIPIDFNYLKPEEKRTKSSHISRWRKTPARVAAWTDYMDGVNSHPISDTPKYKKEDFTFRKANVTSEGTLHSALDKNLYDMLAQVAAPGETFGAHDALGGIFGEPDRILYVESDGTPAKFRPVVGKLNPDILRLRLAIEIKLESVLSTSDLVAKYNEDVAALNEGLTSPGSVKYPVEQIFGYMSYNWLQYGVLTTHNETWFLKREGDTLYVSPTIYHTASNPGIFQCYAHIMNLARGARPMSPAPPTPDVSDDDNHDGIITLSTGFSVAIRKADLNTFIRRDVLGGGRTGTVFLADWCGEKVAMKVCDLYQHPDYEEEVLTEVAVYDALKSLQGNGIPRFKFAGHDGLFFAIATEVAGRPLSEVSELTTAMRWSALNVLSSIHRLGILHNDIRLENILLDPNSNGTKVYFIDFAWSRRSSRKSEFKKEMNQLFSLLGLSPELLSITNTSQLKLPPNTNVSQPKLLPSMNTWSKLPPSMNTRSKLQSIVNSPQPKLLSNGATFRSLASCKNIPTWQNSTRKDHFTKVQKKPRTMNLRTRTISVSKFQ